MLDIYSMESAQLFLAVTTSFNDTSSHTEL